MKLKVLAVLGAAGLLARCGSTPENVDIFNDSARDNYYETLFGTETDDNVYWSQVAAYYGFAQAEDASLAKIGAALATPPTLYSAGSATDEQLAAIPNGEALKAEYDALRTAVAADAIGAGIQAQCGEVVGITNDAPSALNTGFKINADGTTTTLPVAHRIFRYKLKNADGTTETNTRSAVLTIPSTAPTELSPVMIYGHTSTKGLSYGEIAKLFGDLQSAVIIAAPTFPGERLFVASTDTSQATCRSDNLAGDAATAAGVEDDTCGDSVTHAFPSETQTGSHIWDDDVTEMVGLANCLNKAYLESLSSPNINALTRTTGINEFDTDNPGNAFPVNGTVDFKTSVSDKMKSVKVTTANGVLQFPYMMFGGADRGALTAQLAVARAGVMLKDISAGADSALVQAIGATAAAPFPTALVNIGGNYSTTMGVNRVALHSMITSNARFDPVPGWAYLRNSTFAEFRTSTGEDVTEDGELTAERMRALAVEISKRDMVMMEQFVPVALRNWTATNDNDTTTAKGTSIVLHPTQDAVVSYGNAQIAQAVKNNVQIGIAANNEKAETDATKIPGYFHAVYAFQDPTAANWFNCKTGEQSTKALQDACAEGFSRSGQASIDDWDGRVYVGINTDPKDEITDNFNHVGDLSFLGGALASISAEEAAVATNPSTGNDTFQSKVTDTCWGKTEPAKLQGAHVYWGVELFNSKVVDGADNKEPAYPGTYNPEPLTAITPSIVAGSSFLYHTYCIASES